MGLSLERRFERYCDGIVRTLLHADREQPARWYIKGLMLPGERKSVEPMAARTQPTTLGTALSCSACCRCEMCRATSRVRACPISVICAP